MDLSPLWKSFDFNEKLIGTIFACPLEWVTVKQELVIRRDVSIWPWIFRMAFGAVPITVLCFGFILKELFNAQRYIPVTSTIFFLIGACMGTFLIVVYWTIVVLPSGENLTRGFMEMRCFESDLLKCKLVEFER
jgi:hypothetical protein